MSSTRDNIIELARNYMQTIGYHSFNYKLIALQLNIKNASIHHYFPSKEDLALAVIEKDKQDFLGMIRHLATETPADNVEALLTNYNEYFKNGRKLCIISTFGTVFNDVSEKIQMASGAYAGLVIKWLTEMFTAGVKSKEFLFKESPEDMTAIWMAALPGSLSIGRMHGSAYFDRIINRLRTALKEK